MNARTRAAAASVAILLCLGAAALAEEAGTPGAAPTADKGASAAQLIAAIRDATDAQTAATNYVQAVAKDKDNPKLYDTYMKKMLTFGHPSIALYPALQLRRLKAKNGTAWGVMGYSDAKRYKYSTAFTSTMRAMELLPDDPGIQHNAGVLMAWYETRPAKPKLTADLETIVSLNSQQWLGKTKYAEAHRKCKSQFAARTARIKKLKGGIPAAVRAAKGATREGNKAAIEYRRYARAVSSLAHQTAELQEVFVRQERKRDSIVSKSRRAEYDTWIIETSKKIKADIARIKSLKSQRDQHHKRVLANAKIIANARKAVAKARSELATLERAGPKLTWMPPGVDGVVTPEAKARPAVSVSVRTGTEPTTRPTSGPAPDTQLKMAKSLLQNNRKQKAKAILETIVKKHPNSKAAKEAAKLLFELKLKEIGPDDV